MGGYPGPASGFPAVTTPNNVNQSNGLQQSSVSHIIKQEVGSPAAKNAELNVQCFEYNGEIYAKEIWKQKEKPQRYLIIQGDKFFNNKLLEIISHSQYHLHNHREPCLNLSCIKNLEKTLKVKL